MNWDLLQRYGVQMLGGLNVTLSLVAVSVTLGALLALPVALARISDSKLLRGVSFSYVYFFRGTPLLAQTFLVYYGAGQFRAEPEAVGPWWLFREAHLCAILTFTLNTAGYQAEILRGAIQAVPIGQSEAAAALGLKGWVTLRKIILPQAFVIALRPLGNEVILMIKGSAIASVITVYDLMGTTRLAFSRSFDFEVYLWGPVLPLLVLGWRPGFGPPLETRIPRHMRPATAKT